MPQFIDDQGRYHTVDSRGNHFISGKCVNPTKPEDRDIGETVEDYDLTPLPRVLGRIPSETLAMRMYKPKFYLRTPKN